MSCSQVQDALLSLPDSYSYATCSRATLQSVLTCFVNHFNRFIKKIKLKGHGECVRHLAFVVGNNLLIKFAVNLMKILHSVMRNSTVVLWCKPKQHCACNTLNQTSSVPYCHVPEIKCKFIFISQNTYDYELRFSVKILDVFKMNPGLVQLSIQINECESENTILQHLHHGKLFFKLKAL